MQVASKLCLVGWTYRHWPMRRLFEVAADHGCAAVEVRPCADTDLTTLPGIIEALPRAAALASQHNVRLAATYLHQYVVTDAGAVRERNPNFFNPEVLGRLADLGTDVIQLIIERVRPDGSHVLSSHEAEESDFAACREGLEILAENLDRYHLKAAIEVRPQCIADTFEGALWTSGHLDHDSVGMSIDFANLLLTDPLLNLTEAIRTMRNRMVYCHFKNLKFYPWGHDWDLGLRAGSIDYFEVLAAMRQSGYEGWIGLEYCGSGDPDAFIADDMDYLRWLEQRLNREDRWQPTWSDYLG